MVVCKHVIYSGRVQGVGFRFTAQRLASGLKVAGSVKNLSNGDVELIAEGEPGQVDALLQRIAQKMTGYIDEADVEERTPQGLSEFEIKR